MYIMFRLSNYSRRFFISITLTITFLILYQFLFSGDNSVNKLINDNMKDRSLQLTNSEDSFPKDNWRNLTDDQLSRMSTLGKWLLQLTGNTDIPKDRHPENSTEEYLILIWKYGPMLERRHIKHFTQETFSPWEDCSVKNCRLSYDSDDLEKADAVLFHLHQTKGLQDLPENLKFENRIRQRWVFLTDESPFHTFLSGNQNLSNYNGIFNWSMTYRMDSDVPVPYGRTVPLLKKGEKNFDETNVSSKKLTENNRIIEKKTKLVAIMGSNCGGKNHRWDYVRKLEEILGNKLDIYGHCLAGDDKICPGHFAKDCEPLGSYKFYLAFENSNCREYLTEKPFWHGYEKNSVPIIMGASRKDCINYLPPKSYIHVDAFSNPNSLADYLLYLDKSDDEYLSFHEWRNSFKVINEHGYFQSVSRHYCRLCEALNYNQISSKVYENLEDFWNPDKDCLNE